MDTQLCSTCSRIFQGFWQPRLRDDDSQDALLSDTSEDFDAHTDESDFYERPTWEQTLGLSSESSTTSRPPQHYSISALETSAETGCSLCMMIWDAVSARLSSRDDRDAISTDKAIGIVDIRPTSEDDTASLDMIIAYFVDGRYDRSDAFVPITVHFDMLLADHGTDTKPQPLDTTSDVSPATVKSIIEWTQMCLEDHVDCWHVAETVHDKVTGRGAPTRLLDIKPQQSDIELRLVNTDDISPHPTYVTLSHCWGTQLPIRLLEANYSSFLQGIKFEDLPRIFREAITFARNLGVKYIWIDALCIIQDSKTDWQYESLRMAMVYSFAYLNIAATCSTDGHSRLFPKRRAGFGTVCTIDTTWTGHVPGAWLCFDTNSWDRAVTHSSLNSRAWVFQERILAPRTVHFARDQIWWECRALRCNENYPEGLSDRGLNFDTSIVEWLAGLEDQTDIDANEVWLEMVQTYLAAHLTYDSDRLIAIAGIATVVARAMKWKETDYLAGFWRHDILTDLLWRMVDGGTRKLTSFTAPSWSWASVKGEVYFNSSSSRAELRDNMIADLVNVQVGTESSNFGGVKHGSLTLRAHLQQIRLSHATFDLGPTMTRLELKQIDQMFTGHDAFSEILDEEALYGDSTATTAAAIDAAWCVLSTFESKVSEQKYCSEGLILQESPTGLSTSYNRIGWLRLFHDNASWSRLAASDDWDKTGRATTHTQDDRSLVTII